MTDTVSSVCSPTIPAADAKRQTGSVQEELSQRSELQLTDSEFVAWLTPQGVIWTEHRLGKNATDRKLSAKYFQDLLTLCTGDSNKMTRKGYKIT